MSDFVRDLRAHKTMSQFLTKEDLYQSLNDDRLKAADRAAERVMERRPLPNLSDNGSPKQAPSKPDAKARDNRRD